METATATGVYDALAKVVAEEAPDAYELVETTRHAGEEWHTVWLDAGTGRVWHAWADPDDPDAPWTLEVQPAAEAADWIEEVLTLPLEALATPRSWPGYEDGRDDVEAHLDALGELQAVRLAAMARDYPDPVDRDRSIVRTMDLLRAEIGRLSSLRGANLRAAYGSSRGSATAAHVALGGNQETARRAINSGDAYADRARRGADEARARGRAAEGGDIL